MTIVIKSLGVAYLRASAVRKALSDHLHPHRGMSARAMVMTEIRCQLASPDDLKRLGHQLAGRELDVSPLFDIPANTNGLTAYKLSTWEIRSILSRLRLSG